MAAALLVALVMLIGARPGQDPRVMPPLSAPANGATAGDPLFRETAAHWIDDLVGGDGLGPTYPTGIVVVIPIKVGSAAGTAGEGEMYL